MGGYNPRVESPHGKSSQPLDYHGAFSPDVYHERSPGVTRKFTLHDDRLLIEGKQRLQSEFELPISGTFARSSITSSNITPAGPPSRSAAAGRTGRGLMGLLAGLWSGFVRYKTRLKRRAPRMKADVLRNQTGDCRARTFPEAAAHCLISVMRASC